MEDLQKNADRFLGFANTYDEARPKMPLYVTEVILKYLGKTPEIVVDLGCGTGLSMLIWQDQCNKMIGVEPNEDMLKIAMNKKINNTEFVKAFANNTALPSTSADVIICSQSFHWMEPFETLREVNRLLKDGGVFATVDCDWPAVSNYKAEMAYRKLFKSAEKIEQDHSLIKDTYKRWSKDEHLNNIQKSGCFTYAREIVFANTEVCTAERFIKLALSQGTLQTIIKYLPTRLNLR